MTKRKNSQESKSKQKISRSRKSGNPKGSLLKEKFSKFWKANKINTSVIAGILVLTFICYTPSLDNEFTYWDDNHYVTDNNLIKDLSLKGIADIFSTQVAANYHPITMVSLAINYQISGIDAQAYIITNLLLHLFNTFLVFLFIYKLTDGKLIIAVITSLFFGIHPMHVESVSWISERKDVLYTFFMFLALLFYLDYLKKTGLTGYLSVLILFLLSLLSKPAAVVFPVLLLLIDYYKGRKFNTRVVLEKVPYFIFALIIGIVTILVQSEKAMEAMQTFTLLERFLFSGYGFIVYIGKLFFPMPLSALHPFPVQGNLPMLYWISPIISLMIIGLAYYFKRYRIILFGVLFYLVSIAPVLQFITIGNAIIAERYTYVPYVGLFMIIGYLVDRIWQKASTNLNVKILIGLAIAIPSIFFAVVSFQRTNIWQNSETLWTDVINKYQDVPLAYYHRAYFLNENGNYSEALADYDQVLRLNPSYFRAYINRGNILKEMEKYDQALIDYNKAIQLQPDMALAYIVRGNLRLTQKRYSEAMQDFNKVIDLDPSYVDAYVNKGHIFFNQNRYQEAINFYNQAINLNKDYAKVYNERAKAYHVMGQIEFACNDLKTAAELGDEQAMLMLPQLCN